MRATITEKESGVSEAALPEILQRSSSEMGKEKKQPQTTKQGKTHDVGEPAAGVGGVRGVAAARAHQINMVLRSSLPKHILT